MVTVMDWVSRCVLARELSNTVDSEFCVLAPEAFPARDIYNTDQGVQFATQKIPEQY